MSHLSVGEIPSHNPQNPLSGQETSIFGSRLERLFRGYSGPAFAIQFYDESIWPCRPEKPFFTIVLRTRSAWKALVSTPDEVSLGGKYVAGEIDINGDLYVALRVFPMLEQAIRRNLISSAAWIHDFAGRRTDELSRLFHWGVAHSRRRDAASIAHHYDRPSSFYRLWLGPSMVYSCAYFRNWQNSLDLAQHDKLELICRKLNLQPDERFLDIGCGWGSLIMHAAKNFGVAAQGVSLSHEQVDYAQSCISESDLSEWCTVRWRDFRDVAKNAMPFDKLSSVGMCEHVGPKNMQTYFRETYKLLLPGGLFLNHGITRSTGLATGGPSFIDRYVFPDGQLSSLSEMVRAAEDAGFEVRDVEDLREHYEETLHRWGQALSEHEGEAITLAGAETFRTWKLYMAGSAEAFRQGKIAIHQMLLSKNAAGRSASATTRTSWYID